MKKSLLETYFLLIGDMMLSKEEQIILGGVRNMMQK